MHSWHNGAAIIVEPVPFGRRYRCNDGIANDDFNDLIFRLERVEFEGKTKAKGLEKTGPFNWFIRILGGR